MFKISAFRKLLGGGLKHHRAQFPTALPNIMEGKFCQLITTEYIRETWHKAALESDVTVHTNIKEVMLLKWEIKKKNLKMNNFLTRIKHSTIHVYIYKRGKYKITIFYFFYLRNKVDVPRSTLLNQNRVWHHRWAERPEAIAEGLWSSVDVIPSFDWAV